MKNISALLVMLLVLVVLAPVPALADIWGDQINDPSRFIVLDSYGGAAVLDQETGLVWEQSPRTGGENWARAHNFCNQNNVGNRSGWRLPTIQELASLVDPSRSNPALPLGHPFGNVQTGNYWSATTDSTATNSAWAVNSFSGDVFRGSSHAIDKSTTNFFWCVRGGHGVDPQ